MLFSMVGNLDIGESNRLTILSYDNSGEIKFDVDIEMEQGYWNTSSSRLWTKIRDLMHDELVDTYKNMRANGVTYEGIMKYMYDEQIARIPQSYYNQDYDVKYAPYADQYLGKAHGDGLQHMKRWLKKRFIFCDTLFDYAPSYENDILTIRANTLNQMNITIETYTPLYQHVSFYNGNMEKIKVKPGEPITFSGYAQTETDQEVLIYGGSNIKSITGLATTNPNSMLIGSATRLTELDISNCPILSIVNSNKANFSSHVYLNKLNISNCPQLGGNLNVSNSPLLQEINAKGSGITGVLMPTSARNIEILKLPNTLKTLTLNDVPLLHTLEFDEGLAMDSIRISNCNALENYINFDLTQIQNVYLDNAYDNEELYMSITNNLTLMNMPTLKRVIYLPNSEYEEFNVDNMINSGSYKITTFNNPMMTDFIITAPQRLSYKEKDVTEIKPNSVFVANTLDLSDTQFENVKILATSDLYNLKVPTTMKNFYCDSAFDIDTDVIEDASYEIIHNDLIEPYTTNYGNNVLVNGETPNIIPSSANGSLIFNMYSNNTIQPASTSPYIWDLNGLKLNDFYTFGMNNWIKTSDNGSIIMPQRMSGYSVRIVNADITPNQYATHLYPLFINTTLPIVGKIDYTKYQGNTLAWAYAYTTGDVTINPLPSKQLATQITNVYNKLYSTDYVDVRDAWIYKDTNTNTFEINPNITMAYIELTNDNYTARIDEVLQWYPNCTDLYFFEDGSITTLSNMLLNSTYKSQIINVTFMDEYFGNLTNMSNTFKELPSLVEVYNIPNSVSIMDGCFSSSSNLSYISNLPTSLTNMSGTFMNCKALIEVPAIPSRVDNMINTFYGCSALKEAPTIPEGVTNITNTFYGCSALTKVLTIPEGVTNMTNTFYGCSLLAQAPTIPEGVINMSNTFYGCRTLTTAPNIPNSCTNITNCFYGCNKITSVTIPLSNTTSYNNCLYGCSALNNITWEGERSSNLDVTIFGYTISQQDIQELVLEHLANVENATLTLGETFASHLTYDEIFNAKIKGWTIQGADVVVVNTADDISALSTDEKVVSAYIELTNDNYRTRIDEVLQWYPNCTDLYLFDDGSVTSLRDMFSTNNANYKSQIDNVVFLDGYFDNLTNMINAFRNSSSLITVSNIPNSVTDMSYCFRNCSSLTTAPNIPQGVTTIIDIFYGCAALTTPPNIPNGVTNMSNCFYSCSRLTTAPNIPQGVTTMTSCFQGCVRLTQAPTIPQGVTIMASTFKGCTSLTQVPAMPNSITNMDSTFSGCSSLTTVPTIPSSVTNINNTFQGCTKLTQAPAIPSGVTSMSNTFYGCSSLTQAPAIPQGVTIMDSTFSGCISLTTVPNIPDSVTNMQNTFYGCTSLTQVPAMPNSITDMTSTFQGCISLQILDIRDLDTTNMTITGMVTGCTGLKEVRLDNWTNVALIQAFINDLPIVTPTSYIYAIFNVTVPSGWAIHKLPNPLCIAEYTATSSGVIPAFNSGYTEYTTNEVNNGNGTYTVEIYTNSVDNLPTGISFKSKSTLTSVEYLNTKKLTTMSSMFYGCSALTSLDLSNFDTSQVTDMSYMFYNCPVLTSVDVSNFDTKQVTNMKSMFEDCLVLTSIDVRNFDTKQVTNMNGIFYKCKALTSLDLSSWDTSNVTDMGAAFFKCSSLTSLNVSNWDTSNVYEDMDYMFEDCSSLVSLDLSSWSTTSMNGSCRQMFRNCSSLQYLDIRNLDVTRSMFSAFSGCTALKEIRLDNWSTKESVLNATSELPAVTPTSYVYTDFTNVTLPSGWEIRSLLLAKYTCTSSGVAPAFNSGYTGYTTNEVNNGDGTYTTTIRTNDVNNLPTQIIFADIKGKETLISVENLNVRNLTTMKRMFSGCSALVSVNTSNWDTSNVTNMDNMFYYCSNLTSLDVSSFDTSKVTDMAAMFYGCNALTSIDVQGWDTSKATNISWIFNDCTSLTSLDLSNWDTTAITNTSGMFNNCTSLTSLDIRNFDLSAATSTRDMFANCTSLKEVRLDNVQLSSVEKICNRLPEVTPTSYVYTDFTNVTLPSGWEVKSSLIARYTCTSSGVIPAFNSGYTEYTTNEVNNGNGTYTTTIKTNSVDNLPTQIRFYSETTLTSVEYLNTKNLTTMSEMFYNCSALTSLNLSSFNTSNVTSMSSMFYNCTALTSLDLSSFNTSNVTSMSSMFYGCNALTSLDLSNFNTSNVMYMGSMFYDCSALTSLDLSSFNAPNVTNMNNMFKNCSALTSLDLSSFNASNVTYMSSMFYGCKALTSLDLSSFNASKAANVNTMFYACSTLETLYSMKNIGISLELNNTNLNVTSLLDVINNLKTVSSKTLTLGTTLLAKLTDEQKAIAINKGWTLA